MFRCPVCDGSGKTGTTLGFGGSTCNLCQGRCYLNREPTVCPACDGKGGRPAYLGLRWNPCRLCRGVKYLMDKPCPCPKCRATGLVKSYGGLISTQCNLCDRQRFLRQPHGRCIKCNVTSSFVKYFRPCINCGGIGYSPEPQYLCPRCHSTGSLRNNNCMLCGGCGVIHHEAVACAKCGGGGEIRRPLSFLMGRSTCPTCNGQGYFQTLPTSSASVLKSERKRTRDKADSGAGEEGGVVPRDDDDIDRLGGGGGSEGRRMVRGKRTPMTERNRRQTVSSFDMDRPAQPDFSFASKTPARSSVASSGHRRASYGGPGESFSESGTGTIARRLPSPDDEGDGGAGQSTVSDSIFSPGLEAGMGGGGMSTVKRRRHR